MAFKYLVIVESPSKSKTITKYLGKDYKVIASMGHLIDLPASKMGVDIDNDFAPQYITMRGKAKVLKEIKDEAKKAKIVYLATDPDREGEAIAWHIANSLGIPEDGKNRITFNEITQSAVKKALDNVRSIDMNTVDSQQARRILDRLVGYNISPLLWKKVKKGLSAGRVQSVALRIIMDRENEIIAFVPEEYWNLSAKLYDDKSKRSFIAKFYGNLKEKVELKDGKQVEEIVGKIKDKDFEVVSVRLGERKRNPAPPFVTSTLQQEASRKLGFTIKKTMMVAQQLYEQGYITYMRTDSVRLSDEARGMAKEYIMSGYGKEYYENRYYKTKKDAQDAHEAIRPSHANKPDELKEELSNDMYKLYRLIFNRFIASQMTNAVYDTVSMDLKADEYIFRSTGSSIKFKGFMAVYIEGTDNANDEDDEKTVPILKEGQIVKQEDLIYEQKFTEPPSRYTEASLVKFLEERGIGRPSTYAPTINTLLERVYIEKDNKLLVPTELGKVVNDILVNNFKDIVDIEFTADMENKLDEVEEGKVDYVKMLKDFYKPFITNLKEVEDKIEHVKLKDEVSDVPCDKCGAMMVIKTGRFGKFLACPNYPECKNTKPFVVSVDVPCPKCNSKVVIRKSKKGRTFYICENNPETCDYISWTKPKKEKSDD